MNHAPELQCPPEYEEEHRPVHVRKLERPHALVKAQRLAFLRFGKKDLDSSERFWQDFGLETRVRSAAQLVMCSSDGSQAAIVATRAHDSAFLGAAFELSADTDWGQLAKQTGGRRLNPEEIPGGGDGLELHDPEGFAVWLIAPGLRQPARQLREPIHPNQNHLKNSIRINATVRPPLEVARIGRLGHYVLQTARFEQMAQWYMRHLGLIPSDVQYLEDGSTLLCFFRLDLSELPTDHHTVVLACGLQASYEHSAFEVLDLDALGQGQQLMKARGHRHFWGIGRHVLGSQLFDYWCDDDGMQFEHYTDGDLFTSDRPTHYVPFSPGSIWAWGQDAPKEIFPRKSLQTAWLAIRALSSRLYTFTQLKAMASATGRPARPWL